MADQHRARSHHLSRFLPLALLASLALLSAPGCEVSDLREDAGRLWASGSDAGDAAGLEIDPKMRGANVFGASHDGPHADGSASPGPRREADVGGRDAGLDSSTALNPGAAMDAGFSMDASSIDAAAVDAGRDVAAVAASARDPALPDAATLPAPDAGSPCGDHEPLPLLTTAPEDIADIELYADVVTGSVHGHVLPFQPRFELWSDGADKRRWLYLPCGARIDTTDMDLWSFPVGTRVYKEFSVAGKRIETRMIHRFGAGPDDFLFAHYLWREDRVAATLVTESTPAADLESPQGTDYTVPGTDACVQCHGEQAGVEGGLPSRLLGVSAIQLSHDGPGLTIARLSESGRLTRPRPAGYRVPGGQTQVAALGYLHANCGHCHNDTRDGVAFPASPLRLWLKTSELRVYETGAYWTAVGVETLGYAGACSLRVDPDDPGLALEAEGPASSCLYERMAVRDRSTRQMPPLATARVDPHGLAIIAEWIRSL